MNAIIQVLKLGRNGKPEEIFEIAEDVAARYDMLATYNQQTKQFDIMIDGVSCTTSSFVRRFEVILKLINDGRFDIQKHNVSTQPIDKFRKSNILNLTVIDKNGNFTKLLVVD